MTPSDPSLFQGHWFLFLNCPLSFNSWNKTLPVFHPECVNWLLRLGRDLNDCWGGQGKFKVKIKHCAVLHAQPCLLFSLRAIFSQRKTQNWKYILSKGKLESVGEQTYNSSRVSISFHLDGHCSGRSPWKAEGEGWKWCNNEEGDEKKHNQPSTQLQTGFLHKTVVKSGEKEKRRRR